MANRSVTNQQDGEQIVKLLKETNTLLARIDDKLHKIVVNTAS